MQNWSWTQWKLLAPAKQSFFGDDMKSGMTELDEVCLDLKATQYWMKICFMVIAHRQVITAHDIKKLLADLKTQSAEDCYSSLMPGDWNIHQKEYYPAFERVGLSIASVIDGIE